MKRIVTAGISFFLIFLILVFLIFGGRSEGENDREKTIVEIWHVDSFEGGKGSRSAFLRRTAERYEKRFDSVYFYVSVLTPIGVEESLKSGVVPDMVSFSCGVDGVLSYAKGLPYSFPGGMVGEKCYAVPWCAGKYFLFCKEDDFSAVREETVLLSEGGNNLPQVAAALWGGMRYRTADSVSAYTDFLAGRYRYMLGTQRDVCRFAVRGEPVFSVSDFAYADLYQYISLTGEENGEVCLDFLSFLLSEEVQTRLDEIEMYPAAKVEAKYTLSPFAAAKNRGELKAAAEKAITDGDTNFLKTFLKSLN